MPETGLPSIFAPHTVYHSCMPDELLNTLVRFHREVVLPDVERVVESAIGGFRDEMLTHFDALYKRLDRLESEYQALTAAVRGLEERVASLDQKLDRMALRSELLALRDRVTELEQRIAELEAQL